jgi:hypothetical protein
MEPENDDQAMVSAVLASRPEPQVSADFLARVNARIDETAGWLGLADFRVWTLRLAPAAAGLALVAILWPETSPASTTTATATTAVQVQSFSPASATDWQQDISANALLEAALNPAGGDARVR